MCATSVGRTVSWRRGDVRLRRNDPPASKSSRLLAGKVHVVCVRLIGKYV